MSAGKERSHRMEQMIVANIALDIFSIVLSLIPIAYLLSDRRYKQRLNQYFLGVAVSNIFMIFGDLSDWLFRNTTERTEKVTLSILTVIFYAASAFILYFFALYIAEYLKLSGKAKKIFLAAVVFVCAIQVGFALISPFTGFIFYVTDSGYQRGSLFLISQLVPLFCYLLFTALVIIYRKRLSAREVAFFLLYIFVPLSGGTAQTLTRGISLINIGVSFSLLLILVNIQFEYEVALRQQEKVLTEQRIDIMLSQIQPHFLYNALGTIAELCRTDPKRAEKTTVEFANFLRGNMDSLNTREPIPFDQELSHVKNYLYLEQQRFGDRLRVIYDIKTTDFFLPPLSLQPLVENAVRHGILKKREGGLITISTRETDEYAVVMIADDGIGMEKAKKFPNLGDHAHIGIQNVRSRIQTMMEGSMEVESSDQGTVITLQIPWTGGFSCVI